MREISLQCKITNFPMYELVFSMIGGFTLDIHSLNVTLYEWNVVHGFNHLLVWNMEVNTKGNHHACYTSGQRPNELLGLIHKGNLVLWHKRSFEMNSNRRILMLLVFLSKSVKVYQHVCFSSGCDLKSYLRWAYNYSRIQDFHQLTLLSNRIIPTQYNGKIEGVCILPAFHKVCMDDNRIGFKVPNRWNLGLEALFHNTIREVASITLPISQTLTVSVNNGLHECSTNCTTRKFPNICRSFWLHFHRYGWCIKFQNDCTSIPVLREKFYYQIHLLVQNGIKNKHPLLAGAYLMIKFLFHPTQLPYIRFL